MVVFVVELLLELATVTSVFMFKLLLTMVEFGTNCLEDIELDFNVDVNSVRGKFLPWSNESCENILFSCLRAFPGPLLSLLTALKQN